MNYLLKYLLDTNAYIVYIRNSQSGAGLSYKNLLGRVATY